MEHTIKPRAIVPQRVTPDGCSTFLVAVCNNLVLLVKIGDIKDLGVRKTPHVRIAPFAFLYLTKSSGEIDVRLIVGKVCVSDYDDTIFVKSILKSPKDIIGQRLREIKVTDFACKSGVQWLDI